jgi:hypothetical protein
MAEFFYGKDKCVSLDEIQAQPRKYAPCFVKYFGGNLREWIAAIRELPAPPEYSKVIDGMKRVGSGDYICQYLIMLAKAIADCANRENITKSALYGKHFTSPYRMNKHGLSMR